MRQMILNFWQENGTFSMIIQRQIMIIANKITYSTDVLKSSLCDYKDAHILVIGNITIAGHNLSPQVAFKDCAPFSKCVTKIDQTAIDDAENLDLVIPMYNLIEYSLNYSKATASLWFYSKAEETNFNVDIGNTDEFKSLMYKANLFENTEPDGADAILKNSTISVPLK